MDNNLNKSAGHKKVNASSPAGIAAIIVVGIFVLCVILVLAKGLFTSNGNEVPSNLNTATVTQSAVATKTTTTTTTKKAANASADTSTGSSVDSSSANSSSTSSGDSSSEGEVLKVMYVTEYAYLHVSPSNTAENIVCMSPGVKVNVLNYESNGYVKINFQNIDGPLTGYIYKSYLSDTDATGGALY